MFTILLLSAFLLCSNADVVGLCNSSVQYSVRCSDGPREGGSSVIVQAADVAGSYDVEYCEKASPDPESRPTNWVLGVKYLADVPADLCRSSVLGITGVKAPKHSLSDLALDYNLNCTYDVCFKQRLDLLFRSCYRLENRLFTRTSKPYNSYHYIDNNITSKEYYFNSTPRVHDIQHDTFLSFSWYTGLVPLTHYSIEVCKKHNNVFEECRNACDNCTRVSVASRTQLSCRLQLSSLCYRLQLTHREPWTNAIMFIDLKNTYGEACPTSDAGGAALQAVGGGGAWWWGGAGAGLCACAALALYLTSERYLRKLRERVRGIWLSRRLSEVDSSGRKAAELPPQILLLYARDAAAVPLVAALKSALETVTGGEVHDIFSPAVTARAGPAPHSWVAAALRDMRVLLLQLPALRILHTDQLQQGRLSEPLLARSVRRAPVFGDTLLQYALRILTDTHAAHDEPYRHYYLATLAEFPEDLFPYVTPFRRYELPGATAVLLRDVSDAANLSDVSDTNDATRKVDAAAADLAAFLRNNAHYLDDDIIMLQ